MYIRQRSVVKDRHWSGLKAGLLYYQDTVLSTELQLKLFFPFWKWICSPPFRGIALLGHPQFI